MKWKSCTFSDSRLFRTHDPCAAGQRTWAEELQPVWDAGGSRMGAPHVGCTGLAGCKVRGAGSVRASTSVAQWCETHAVHKTRS